MPLRPSASVQGCAKVSAVRRLPWAQSTLARTLAVRPEARAAQRSSPTEGSSWRTSRQGRWRAAEGARPVTRLAAGLCSTTHPSASTATMPSSVEASQAWKIPASTACMPPVPEGGASCQYWNADSSRPQGLPDFAEIPRLHQPTRGGAPMSEAFLSSDDFDEQAHQLYNEGRYDEASDHPEGRHRALPARRRTPHRKGLRPSRQGRVRLVAAELRQRAGLDPDHEDGLAGLGETLLKLGDREGAHARLRADPPARLPGRSRADAAGGARAVPRGADRPAHRFFDLAAAAHPESPDAAACLGYASHRLGNDAGSLYWLRRALELEPGFAEARIYLANLLYDRGETEAALHHLERTQPEDHFDELGIWRHIELKKSVYRLPDEDPELKPWLTRLGEVSGRARRHRHAAGRGRGHPRRRRRARSAPARAVRHAAERAARDAEEAGHGRVAPGRHPVGAVAPGQLGRDPAPDEGGGPGVGPGLAAASS